MASRWGLSTSIKYVRISVTLVRSLKRQSPVTPRGYQQYRGIRLDGKFNSSYGHMDLAELKKLIDEQIDVGGGFWGNTQVTILDRTVKEIYFCNSCHEHHIALEPKVK